MSVFFLGSAMEKATMVTLESIKAPEVNQHLLVLALLSNGRDQMKFSSNIYVGTSIYYGAMLSFNSRYASSIS